jgi:hypothetical protein
VGSCSSLIAERALAAALPATTVATATAAAEEVQCSSIPWILLHSLWHGCNAIYTMDSVTQSLARVQCSLYHGFCNQPSDGTMLSLFYLDPRIFWRSRMQSDLTPAADWKRACVWSNHMPLGCPLALLISVRLGFGLGLRLASGACCHNKKESRQALFIHVPTHRGSP